MNRYEHFKTGILIALVSLSVVLTWKLWTFQPDIPLLDDSTQYIPSEIASEERKLTDVIKPEQIIVHHQAQYGLISPKDPRFVQLYETLLSSTFENKLTGEELNAYPQKTEKGGIEIIFPTAIPVDIFLGLFQEEDEEFVLPMTDVNRLYLYHEENKDQVHMQLLSSEEKRVAEVTTNFIVEDFERYILTGFEDYQKMAKVDRPHVSPMIHEDIYIYQDSVTVERLSFTVSTISGQLFRQALFIDPDSVRYYRKSDSEESYTDGSRIIEIRNNGLFMEYNNPVFSDLKDRGNKHIVQSSYEFINGHGGWTDDYLLMDWVTSDIRDEADYQLHINDYPVINFEGLDQMVLHISRSGNQTERYLRPLFDVASQPIDARQPVELGSGQDVINHLKQQDFFDINRLQKIMIGYEMKMPSRSFVTVEPNWFIRYDNRWQKVVFDLVEEAESNELE